MREWVAYLLPFGLVAAWLSPFLLVGLLAVAKAKEGEVAVQDIKVRVFRDTATERHPRTGSNTPPSRAPDDTRVGFIPVDGEGLHVFCNVRRGHLIYVYRDTIAVVEGGCR